MKSENGTPSHNSKTKLVLVFIGLSFLACVQWSLVAGESLLKNAGQDAAQPMDWWAFKPTVRPRIPEIESSAGPTQNPIDNFILEKLAEHQLHASAEASRPVLIRRLSFDLTGLPPTPAEIDAFVSDTAPEAYEKLVDRLLSTPRYGERWARHWLDLVHFGETHGYDKDKLRPNAWPYRDYVIRAFNRDKPYTRFVEEQLAGDALFPEDPDGIVALGFIAAGPWDFVGHVELPITKTDGLIARYNDRDDMVMTTMSTFESLTVHCARCHNHKFDPITQQDYYSLQAVFAGVDRANRPYDEDPGVYQKRRELEKEKVALEEHLNQTRKTIASITNPELQMLDRTLAEAKGNEEERAAKDQPQSSPSNGYHSKLESSADSSKWVQVDLGSSQPVEVIRLFPARPTDFADTPGFGFPVRFKLEMADETDFSHSINLMDHTQSDYANPGDVPLTLVLEGRKGRYIRVTATRLWERAKDFALALAELQVFSHGTNLARGAAVIAKDSIEEGRWGAGRLVDGFSSRARLNENQPTAESITLESNRRTRLTQLTAARNQLFVSLISPSLKSDLKDSEVRLEKIIKQLGGLPPAQMVYAAANQFPTEGNFAPAKEIRPVYLLTRGDVKRPKDLMLPAGLPAVPGPNSKFTLTNLSDESARRVALSQWITDPRNLLTRRSIVNRIWQYHFGRGIVDTPNDFGHMGSLPTHPELLDWLAYWFLDHGESFKKLHRLIVTSATYRQSSHHDPHCAEIDADNRYLWRMNRARLDAESVRDSMLFASGRLDLRMGGPSDRHFAFKDDHSPEYDYTRFNVDSSEACRRSIYRLSVRSVPDPFMDCLDAADPSQLVARRYTTLTALQALATLNNPFVLRQCEAFAERLSQSENKADDQITLACRLAWSRRPTSSELNKFVDFTQKHGLANFCRVMFNSPEFSFVD